MYKIHGYVLVSPTGRVVVSTFDIDKSGAQQRAFDHLNAVAKWPSKFYKKWNEFVKERVKRGWTVETAEISATYMREPS